MYKFSPIKRFDTDTTDFEGAILAARESIESVLDDDNLVVAIIDKTTITIGRRDGFPMKQTLAECKEAIKGCFQDENRVNYPEFASIGSCEIHN